MKHRRHAADLPAEAVSGRPAQPRRAREKLLGALVCASLLAPPPLWAQQAGNAASARASTPVTLNFVNADIEAVTRAMGAILDKQFLVDPRVKGTITVYSEQPLSVAQAYQNYLAALRGLGFAVVESGGLLKVVPEADAKLQTGTVTIGGSAPRGDQVVTQIFKLSHENPNNLVAVLRPLISANNTINANPSNSTLVITDYADNLQRLGKIIAALDQPAATDVEVVQLQHAVASDMAAMVQRLADGTGGAATPGVPVAAGGGSSGTSVLADPRSNSLIVRATNAAKLVQIRAIIDKLDRPIQGGGPGGNIWVVYLRNADAVKLATVLRAAFSPGGGGGGGSVSSSGSSSSGGISGLQNTGGFGSNSSSTGSLSGSSSSGGTGSSASTAPLQASQGPSTGGFIQADPSTNSLIITAPEPLYRQVRNAIDQLDTRRAQIYVESMIVKVDATKMGQFGVQWQHLFGNSGDKTLFGLGTNSSVAGGNILGLTAGIISGVGTEGASTALNSVGKGLNLGIVQKIGSRYTLGAIANFLENNVGANLLSTPNLISLDNEEAKIVIGQNVPFVTGTYTTSSTSSTSPFQTIERQDVGLTLRIKSQIGEGGTIRMTIYQENSSVLSTSASAGPTTDKSAIETSVVVDDGQIMVLGGLLKDEYTDGEDRVPGLSGIPVLGNLFRNEQRKRVKTNLMVFLRPVVIRDQATANSLTIDRYESIRSLQQTSQPAQSVLIPVNEAPVLPALPPQPIAPVPKPLGEGVLPPEGAASGSR